MIKDDAVCSATTRRRVATICHHRCILLLAFFWLCCCYSSPSCYYCAVFAAASTTDNDDDENNDPVADPAAVVRAGDGGRARFTILTPQTIRLEWHPQGGGKFRDEATIAVPNRRIRPVPEYAVEYYSSDDHYYDDDGENNNDNVGKNDEESSSSKRRGRRRQKAEEWMTITTSHLVLKYKTTSRTSFSEDNLKIELRHPVGSNNKTKHVSWTPSANQDEGRLPGTIRTLDMVNGSANLDCNSNNSRRRYDLHCTMGLISTSGFAVVDDTHSATLDGSPWPWVIKEDDEEEEQQSATAAAAAAGSTTCQGIPEAERRQCGRPVRALTRSECEGRGCCFATTTNITAKEEEHGKNDTPNSSNSSSFCFYGRESRQDLYFFGHGHDYKQALLDYTALGGRIPIPPRFAFGVFYSKYWAYNDVEIWDEIVQGYASHAVPLDVLVLDMDWHLTFYGQDGQPDQAGQRKGWTGYTWDQLLFSNATQFISRLHALGIKVTLNLHPASGVQPWEESYPRVARIMGIDPSSRRYVPFRITDRKFATALLTETIGPLERVDGVDFWWLDWQQGEDWFLEKEGVHTDLNPTLWLNYVFSTNPNRWTKADDDDSLRRRPLIMHRFGGLGNHRYPLGFSGDVVPSWESLANQPYFTSAAANALFGYWSHDIGGHTAVTQPELYVRWIQWGALSPVFRTHCTKQPGLYRRIWMYDYHYERIMRDAILMRAELIPYIYTQAWRAHVTGLSIVRGLYYDYPELSEAYEYSNRGQYMCGDSFMVSPVVSPLSVDTGLARQDIWIPPGDDGWFGMFSGRIYPGGAVVPFWFDLSEIPLFAKAGAIIPKTHIDPLHSNMPGSSMLGRSERLPTTLVLEVIPGGSGTGTGQVYEDDGKTMRYLDGQHAVTNFSYRYNTPEWTSVQFRMHPRPRGTTTFDGELPERNYKVVFLASWPAESVRLLSGGRNLTVEYFSAGRGFPSEDQICWTYNGRTLSLEIQTGPVRKEDGVGFVLDVTFALPNRVGGLPSGSGFAGKTRRLQAAKRVLDDHFGQVYMTSYPNLLKATSTASRITYNASSAHEELRAFETGLYLSAVNEVENQLDGLDAGVKNRLLWSLKYGVSSSQQSQSSQSQSSQSPPAAAVAAAVE